MLVHDAVVCWRCHRDFSLLCLGGPAAIMGALGEMTGGGPPGMAAVFMPEHDVAPDAAERLVQWSKCPRCDAPLGAVSMPTVFRTMVGQTLQRGGHGGFQSDAGVAESETSLRSISVELDHSMAAARTAEVAGETRTAIDAYTRAIVCANVVRATDRSSTNTSLVLGLKDAFLKAHAKRASLEGKAALHDALLAAAPESVQSVGTALFLDPTATRAVWRFRDGPDAAYLDRTDFARLWPGQELRMVVGPGVEDAPPPAYMPQYPAQLSAVKDPAFQMLDSELRELRFWIPRGDNPMALGRGPGCAMLTQIFDFRWCFRSLPAARKYFEHMRATATEETGVFPLTRTGESLASLSTHSDSDVIVLRSSPPVASGKTKKGKGAAGSSSRTNGPMMAMNALFRAGRICGKVYLSAFVDHTVKRAHAEAAMLAVADHAAAKAAEAAQQPLSVRDGDGQDGELAERLLDARE